MPSSEFLRLAGVFTSLIMSMQFMSMVAQSGSSNLVACFLQLRLGNKFGANKKDMFGQEKIKLVAT